MYVSRGRRRTSFRVVFPERVARKSRRRRRAYAFVALIPNVRIAVVTRTRGRQVREEANYASECVFCLNETNNASMKIRPSWPTVVRECRGGN